MASLPFAAAFLAAFLASLFAFQDLKRLLRCFAVLTAALPERYVLTAVSTVSLSASPIAALPRTPLTPFPLIAALAAPLAPLFTCLSILAVASPNES